MPIKYILGNPELVRIVGMAHGILFENLLFLAEFGLFVTIDGTLYHRCASL